ncbi:hypothetical protein BDA99DRAFT_536988 [Phascolomyces articulosus]|uniref:Uncharacterized protein n=1 Tax=Phascolomyces articulosus TaxID=60185 RepID=A0AAD5K1G0_9FUNG|nr:hypothetical protein BDA99DRAFT_536988 [Phascolomyces articulosus]
MPCREATKNYAMLLVMTPIQFLTVICFAYWRHVEVVLAQITSALECRVLPEYKVELPATPVVMAPATPRTTLPARPDVLHRSSFFDNAEVASKANKKNNTTGYKAPVHSLVMPIRRSWTDIAVIRARRDRQEMPTWHPPMEIDPMDIDHPIDELVGHFSSLSLKTPIDELVVAFSSLSLCKWTFKV